MAQLSQPERKPIDEISLYFRPSIVAALANLGNTCFANSSLQVIANLPTIVGALRFVCRLGVSSGGDEKGVGILPPSHSRRTANVVRCAVQTLDRMERGEELVVRPIELIRSVQEVNETFASGIGEQHDAAEWLLHGVLDACDDYRVDRSIAAKHLSAAFDELKNVPNGTASPRTGARFRPGKSWTSQAKLNVWKVMARVDDENAKEEWEEKKRKNGLAAAASHQDFDLWKRTSYCSPFIVRTAALDAMRGTFLQETKCNSCGHVSRIFNPLSSFELSFPSAAERVAYREMVEEKKYQTSSKTKSSPSHQQVDDTHSHSSSDSDCGVTASSSLIWRILFLPCAIFTSIGRAISRVCHSLFGSAPDEPVTIDELLWAYCRSRGSRFRCSKCNKAETSGSITIRVLDLPQVLAIHLKRFEQSSFGGLWTEKIPDFVEFPGSFDATDALPTTSNYSSNNNNNNSSSSLNSYLAQHKRLALDQGSPLSDEHSGKGLVLDLAPFTVPILSEQQAQDSTGSSSWASSSSSSSSSQLFISTYNLNSVINHHGSISGGHYTAFCKKPPTQFEGDKPRWALFNDSRASEVGNQHETVLQSQAYILMYEKEPLCQEGEEMTKMRRMAKEYLLGGVRRAANRTVRVPRMWMFRVATFAEPGPLLHRVGEFDAQDVPAAAYVNVSNEDYDNLVDVFGELLLPAL